MSYTTKEDVKKLFRDFADNTDAAVDDNDLDLFIENTAEVIDSKIGTVYALPITEADNPKSFKVLKMLHMFKVACIVDDILNNYSEADKKPQWCKKAKELMMQLVPEKAKDGCKQCEPTMKLPDATYLGVTSERNRITVSSTQGTQFKKGTDTW